MKTLTLLILKVALVLPGVANAEVSSKAIDCSAVSQGFEEFREVLSQSSYSFWGYYAKGYRGNKKPGNFELLKSTSFVCGVVRNRASQPEFVKPPWRYVVSKSSDKRKRVGLYLLGDRSALQKGDPVARRPYTSMDLNDLKEISQNNPRYSKIHWSYPMAVWSMETSYGQVMGSFSVLDVLMTLAFMDQPAGGPNNSGFKSDPQNRAYRKYFNKLHNVFDALWIYEQLRKEDPTIPEDATDVIIGSWAGAFGHTQFMPSTYRSHYNNSLGILRTWEREEPLEALTLTHEFFAKVDFDENPWGIQVDLLPGREAAVFNKLHSRGCGSTTVKAWLDTGLKYSAFEVSNGTSVPQETTKACLHAPMGAAGPLFLTLKNFDALKKYNGTSRYALAGSLLAEKFRGLNRTIAWPKGLRTLSSSEVKRLQGYLGFTGKSVDGIAGNGTMKYIYKVQRACQNRSVNPEKRTSAINKLLQYCRNGSAPIIKDGNANRDFVNEVKTIAADGHPTEIVLFALDASLLGPSGAQAKFDDRGLGHFERVKVQEYLGFTGDDLDGIFGSSTRSVFAAELKNNVKVKYPSLDVRSFSDKDGNPTRAFLNFLLEEEKKFN